LNNIRALFIFFFLTTTGSVLSTIGSFLITDQHFNIQYLLPIALSAKTLTSVLFASQVPRILSRLNFKKTLIISELIGIFSVLVLLIAHQVVDPVSFVFGISVSMFPAIALRNCILTFFSQNIDHYKQNSGKLQTTLGLAFLSGTLLAPFLIQTFSYKYILLIDFISYFSMIIFLFFAKDLFISKKTTETQSSEDQNKIKKLPLSHNFTMFFNIVSILIISGFLPLIASSNSDIFSLGFKDTTKDYFWIIESSLIIIIGFLHSMKMSSKLSKAILCFSKFNTIILIAMLTLPISLNLLVIGLILISFTSNYGFIIFRDEVIIKNKFNINTTSAILSHLQIFQSLTLSISPIILLFLWNKVDRNSGYVLFATQCIFYLTSTYKFSKYRSNI